MKNLSSVENAEEFLEIGKKQINEGKLTEAVVNFQKASTIFKEVGNWGKWLDSEIYQSYCFCAQGKYKEAIAIAENAETLGEKYLDKINDNLGNLYRQIALNDLFGTQNYVRAKLYLDKALEIKIANFGEEHIKTAAIYNTFGMYYSMQELGTEAIIYQRKALKILNKAHNGKHIDIALAIDNLAYAEGGKGNYNKKLFYSKKALQQYLKLVGEGHPFVATTYSNIGIAYGFLGDFNQELIFLLKSKATFQNYNIDNLYKKAVLYLDIATCYGNLKKFDLQLDYINMSFDLLDNFENKNSELLAYSLMALADCQINLKQYDLAINSCNKYFETVKATYGENSTWVSDYYTKLSDCYTFLNEVEKEIEFRKLGLKIRISAHGERHPETAQDYNKLADCYQKNADYDNQKKYAQLALKCCCYNFTFNDEFELPQIKEIKVLNQGFNALKTLASAFHLNFLNTKQSVLLDMAFKAYDLLDALILKMKRSYKIEDSKLLLSASAEEIYENAVKVAFELKDFEKAFYFAEQGKASILLSNIQELSAKTNINIPIKLLTKEKELQIELSYLEKTIAAQKNNEDSELLSKLQAQYFDFKSQYDKLIEGFEKNYPKYYELKYDNKIVTVKNLQRLLPENKIVVSYFIAKNCYYIFLVENSNTSFLEFEKPADFDDAIDAYGFLMQNDLKRKFFEVSNLLYNWLIAPVEHLINKSSDAELTIIPHKKLFYLPFETLVKNFEKGSTDYNNANYLLKDFVISYHLSATLFLDNLKSKQNEMPESFCGFAPIYDQLNSEEEDLVKELKDSALAVRGWNTESLSAEKDAWQKLPYSKKEMEGVHELFETRKKESSIFLYDEASKGKFVDNIANAKYVLIAAHGIVNEENPKLSGLVFYPDKLKEKAEREIIQEDLQSIEIVDFLKENYDNILSMQESYLLELNADLVVLSSCESGLGKLAKGEGMMAINRGFLYSGAKNIIFTLFKVMDKPSSILVKTLFENILSGQTYVKALRNAKLSFLTTENAQPKNWAAYIILGS